MKMDYGEHVGIFFGVSLNSKQLSFSNVGAPERFGPHGSELRIPTVYIYTGKAADAPAKHILKFQCVCPKRQICCKFYC